MAIFKAKILKLLKQRVKHIVNILKIHKNQQGVYDSEQYKKIQ